MVLSLTPTKHHGLSEPTDVLAGLPPRDGGGGDPPENGVQGREEKEQG